MNLSPVMRRKKRMAPNPPGSSKTLGAGGKYEVLDGHLAPPNLASLRTKVGMSHSNGSLNEIGKSTDQPVSKTPESDQECCQDGECLLCLVRKNVAGKDAVFTGPFGQKKVIYCDYTASGKSLDFVEKFISEFVAPFYANTHTSCNITGRQTSDFRRDARDIIKKCVNASEDDVVIFTGSGTTAAVNKLVSVLQLDGARAKRTVVMTGPFEHHSNILPWKEKKVRFERISQSKDGLLDTKDLERKLRKYHSRGYHIIVALSAASNVSGIKTDTVKVTELIHKYGGLSFWDFAAGGPYMKIDMNPSPTGAKDAVYLSPHKFVGGPGTPGLLIAKKKLFHNAVPHAVGGGTVVYVTRETRLFHDNIEDREEGGTPAIVESVRAGLVFKIKKEIGEHVIEEREEKHCRQVFSQLGKHPGIRILGSAAAPRLPIFSLLFYNPQSGKYLHHNFISVLLNDLYGIQVRSGCACAGPYAMDLLDMDEKTATRFAALLSDGWCCKGKHKCQRKTHGAIGIMKPGFSRFNMPYFVDEETAEYVLHGISMVATHGWKLLPMYYHDVRTGDWHHRTEQTIEVNSLHNLHITKTGVSMESVHDLSGSGHVSLQAMKMDALKTFTSAETTCKKFDCSQDQDVSLGKEYEELRWFMLPAEASELLDTSPDKRPYIMYPDAKLPFKTTTEDESLNQSWDSHSIGGDSAYSSVDGRLSPYQFSGEDRDFNELAEEPESPPERCYSQMCTSPDCAEKSEQLAGIGFQRFAPSHTHSHNHNHSPCSSSPPSDDDNHLSLYRGLGGNPGNRLAMTSKSMSASTPNLGPRTGKKAHHHGKDGCVIC